jgi:hypothetical protein
MRTAAVNPSTMMRNRIYEPITRCCDAKPMSPQGLSITLDFKLNGFRQ